MFTKQHRSLYLGPRAPFSLACLLLAAAVALVPSVGAQNKPEPVPAFRGQTDAPPPATRSTAFTIETLAGGLTGAWALAFLPDGNILVSQNSGTMRIVRPGGIVSAPLEGVPPVKSVAR